MVYPAGVYTLISNAWMKLEIEPRVAGGNVVVVELHSSGE